MNYAHQRQLSQGVFGGKALSAGCWYARRRFALRMALGFPEQQRDEVS